MLSKMVEDKECIKNRQVLECSKCHKKTNMSPAFDDCHLSDIRQISQNSWIVPNDRNKIKFNNQSKNNGECHYCGYKGHFIKDCRKRLYDLRMARKNTKGHLVLIKTRETHIS